MPKVVISSELLVHSKKKNSTNYELRTTNSSGFTLIELLVSITIIGILSVSSFVYFKSLTRDKAVLKAVDSVQTLIRTAQINAASGFDCDGVKGATKWTIKFNDDKSTIGLLCDKYVSGVLSTRLIRTLTLENNIRIDSITGSSCPTPDWPVNIFYAPLNGGVSFKNGVTDLGNCLTSNTALTVTLKDANDSTLCSDPANVCKSFTISNGGAINVQ